MTKASFILKASDKKELKMAKTIWLEDLGRKFYGHAWAVSSETHDAIEYTADSMEEAVAKYEKDRRCKVRKVHIVE